MDEADSRCSRPTSRFPAGGTHGPDSGQAKQLSIENIEKERVMKVTKGERMLTRLECGRRKAFLRTVFGCERVPAGFALLSFEKKEPPSACGPDKQSKHHNS